MNELLFFAAIAGCFGLLLAAYRFFGKLGIFAWIAVAMIISTITAAKIITLFGMSVTLGNVAYGSSYLATDILCEKYGKKEAEKTVLFGFFMLTAFVLLMWLAVQFVPGEGDFAQPGLELLFTLAPRIAAASLLTYLIMQRLDILIYSAIRAKTGEKYLWLRNNAATLTTQLLDTALFTVLAFAGVHPWSTVFTLIVTTYAVKIIVSLLDTPFLYLSRRINPSKKYD